MPVSLHVHNIFYIVINSYCDCFANGEFCREACNCHSCKNNMEYAEDRAKAVKVYFNGVVHGLEMLSILHYRCPRDNNTWERGWGRLLD